MSDVCHAGNTVRNTEVYIETNVYHVNNEHFNTTCSCVVSTECDHRLFFHPLELQLTSGDDNTCLEQVTMVDGSNGSVSITLDCSSNDVRARRVNPDRLLKYHFLLLLLLFFFFVLLSKHFPRKLAASIVHHELHVCRCV